MKHLNLKYGDKVTIQKTNTELDGLGVTVIGVSTRHIIDTYIVEFSDGKTRITIENGIDHEFRALTLPEGCLEVMIEESSEKDKYGPIENTSSDFVSEGFWIFKKRIKNIE